MAKETFYFQHDYNARNDDKILELRANFGAEGYGVFWMLIETMAENDNGGAKAGLLGGLSLGYGVAKARLLEIVNYCIEIGLLYEENGFYYSKRLQTHKEFRKVLSENGSAGAAKRWGGYKGGHSHPNAKERKGKENIEKAIFFENDFAVFSDGTRQPLNDEQIKKLHTKRIMPNEVEKITA